MNYFFTPLRGGARHPAHRAGIFNRAIACIPSSALQIILSLRAVESIAISGLPAFAKKTVPRLTLLDFYPTGSHTLIHVNILKF